jgi:hypothetical protein
LQATIGARIDRLDLKAKRTLSAAAVIGSRFGLDLLTVLGVEPVIADLLAVQLIDQVSFIRQPEYVFHHPLIRAVAYESQLKSDRAELHRRVAAAIESRDPAAVEENAALIAEHLEAAGDLHAAYGWHMRAATWARNRDAAAARLRWERAISLTGRGHGDQAEEILAGIGVDDPDGHHWATVRAANLIWNLGRPREASAILDGLASRRESVAEQVERAAIESCVDAVMARSVTAAEKARAALSSPTRPDFHAMLASIALTIAEGALGRIDDISDVVAEAIDRAITFQGSPMRFWYGGVYARACRLNGRIDECVRSAQQLSESARDVPGVAFSTYVNLPFLLGHAELA